MKAFRVFPCTLPQFLLYALALFALVYWLSIYWQSFSLAFFNGDDLNVLKHAISYSPLEYFFIPEVWQGLSPNNYTPWVVLSYQIDWLVFGFNHLGYYLHQLVISLILLWLIFLLLKQYLSNPYAILVVALFSLSPAFVETAKLLWTRHYLEGLLFSLLSIHFLLLGVRHNKFQLILLAALFYWLACLCKEVYIPLIGIILLLLWGKLELKQIAKILSPFVLVVIAYFVLRYYMLHENMISGYNYQYSWHDTLLFFPNIINAMNGGFKTTSYLWLGFISLSLLASSFLLANARQTLPIKLLLGSLLFLLPIIPVSKVMGGRYVLHISLGFIILHALAWQSLDWHKLNYKLRFLVITWILSLTLLFVYASSHLSWIKFDALHRLKQEAIFILWHSDTIDVILAPQDKYIMDTWLWMKQKFFSDSGGNPLIIHDQHVFCANLSQANNQGFAKVWSFNSEKQQLSALAYQDWIAQCANYLPKKAHGISWSITMRQENHSVYWQFEPQQESHYAIILKPSNLDISVASSGAYYLGKQYGAALNFQIRYINKTGLPHYSPEFTLQIGTEKDEIFWKNE